MVRTTNRVLQKTFRVNPAHVDKTAWGRTMPILGIHAPVYRDVDEHIRKKNPMAYAKKIYIGSKKSSSYEGAIGHMRLFDRPRKKLAVWGAPMRWESGGLRKAQEKGPHRDDWPVVYRPRAFYAQSLSR